MTSLYFLKRVGFVRCYSVINKINKMSCNKCFQTKCYCSPIVSSTTINSEQAGRDGLSAKQILINTGRLPANATDADFANYIQGGTTIVNTQIYAKTDW